MSKNNMCCRKYIKKKLAIIGASYLQVPLINKAKDLGIETHVFAWKSNDLGEQIADFFYPISIIEKEQILEKCIEIGIDGICSIASDLAVITVNYVASSMGLISNPLASTSKTTNKYQMRKAFEDNNIPSTKCILVDSIDVVNTETLNYPIIVKPTDRSGSRGITFINEADILSIENAVNFSINVSLENKALIEEYIPGKEYSVECISWNGTHTMLAITEKFTTGHPNFIETAQYEPARIDNVIKTEIEKIVFEALDSLDIKYGASHSEIKVHNNTIRIIEIGARMGGDFIGSDLVYQTTGVDFVRAVIDISLGIKPDLSSNHALKSCGVRFIFNHDDMDILEKINQYDSDILLHSEVNTVFNTEITDSSTRNGYFVIASCNPDRIIEYMP